MQDARWRIGGVKNDEIVLVDSTARTKDNINNNKREAAFKEN